MTGLMREDDSNRRPDEVAWCWLRLMVIVDGLVRVDSIVLGRGGW